MKKITIQSGMWSFLILTTLLLGLQACRKSNPTIQGTVIPYDNSTKVVASLYGIITDESGQAIEDAVVRVAGYQMNTDVHGFYHFENITIPQHATTIHVSKDGYFNGSRAMMVKAGQKHTLSLTLLKRENPQTFMSSNGGNLNFNGGLNLSFPYNSVVNKATGQAYHGQVFVYAKTINPTTELGRNTMPGDLRGMTAAGGEERLLQSFGMFVAELYAADGTELQVADGAEITMTLSVPTSLIGKAPATIPLWYYNETKEMWVEEGSAQLVGGKYVGKVKHFSFWNCDTPEAANITIEMTLVDINGNPLNNYSVKLTNLSNNDSRYGTTNTSGWVGGLCYSNATLLLEIFEPGNICGTIGVAAYSQTIATSSTNLNVGTIIVPSMATTPATISGSVVDCSNVSLSNAAVLVAPYNILITPNAAGNFTYTFPCVPNQPITLYTYDLANNVYGSSVNYTLVAGSNNVGVQNACGNVTQFLTITLTNTTTSVTMTKTFTMPTDTVATSISLQNQSSSVFAMSNTNQYFAVTAVDSLVGTWNASSVTAYFLPNFTDTQFSLDPGSTVTYTTFPGFPGDVTGSFSLNLVGNPSGNSYTATGTFRAPRKN